MNLLVKYLPCSPRKALSQVLISSLKQRKTSHSDPGTNSPKIYHPPSIKGKGSCENYKYGFLSFPLVQKCKKGRRGLNEMIVGDCIYNW